jgi:hypothetical protein
MNNNQTSHHVDIFGSQVANRLNESTEKLPFRVTQRLENSRKAALAAMPAQSLSTATSIQSSGKGIGAILGGFGFSSGWGFKTLAFAVPVAVLFCGFLLISAHSEDVEADEQSSIDAAMLTEDVPISAYTDRGFGVHIHNVQQ